MGWFWLEKAQSSSSYKVAIGFGLDQARYAADLRKHGVHIKDMALKQIRISRSPID
jgi:hypothetical protein